MNKYIKGSMYYNPYYAWPHNPILSIQNDFGYAFVIETKVGSPQITSHEFGRDVFDSYLYNTTWKLYTDIFNEEETSF